MTKNNTAIMQRWQTAM